MERRTVVPTETMIILCAGFLSVTWIVSLFLLSSKNAQPADEIEVVAIDELLIHTQGQTWRCIKEEKTELEVL